MLPFVEQPSASRWPSCPASCFITARAKHPHVSLALSNSALCRPHRSSSQLPGKAPPPLKGAMRLPVEQCSHLAWLVAHTSPGLVLSNDRRYLPPGPFSPEKGDPSTGRCTTTCQLGRPRRDQRSGLAPFTPITPIADRPLGQQPIGSIAFDAAVGQDRAGQQPGFMHPDRRLRDASM